MQPNVISINEHKENSLDKLIKDAQKGSVSSFERIYLLFEKRLFALCLRMSGNNALAEEFLQEVFLLIWKKLNQFNGDSQFSTWIHRIAVNHIISYFRVKKNCDFTHDELDTNLFSTAFDNQSFGRDLENAIATLPDKARLVFVMYEIEGLSHQEIAEQTDTSVGTSKAQLHRAKKLLQERLA